MNTNNKTNILVIDDDPVITRLLETRLKDNGYNVVVSTEAPAGLEEAMSCDYQVIVLDVMMPIINGYNICHLLKNEEVTKSIPIILLTSRDDKEDIEIGLDMGADAYLLKPVNVDELLKTITLVVAASSPSDG